MKVDFFARNPYIPFMEFSFNDAKKTLTDQRAKIEALGRSL
jgi:hypothetical protein